MSFERGSDVWGSVAPRLAPRRVLFVVTGLGWGGAESQVIDLARHFSVRGWDVAVASLLNHAARSNTLVAQGIPVHTLGMLAGRPDPRAIVRLARVVRIFGPDVVHAHMLHANLLARVARVVTPFPVLITSAHNTNEGAAWRMWAYRATDPLTDLTTNVSSAGVERSLQRGATRRGKITCMPNGIDTLRFKSDPALRAAVRRELDIGDRFCWLCVSSLERQKDYPNLFQALRWLKDHPARPIVLAVGDGSLREELVARAAELPNLIHFLGCRSDVHALMAAADGYVLSSAWEGLPLVLLEASASGLPVVCTDVGGNHEVVVHGETGFLVPPEQSDALAVGMSKVMNFPETKRKQMGIRARAHVTKVFGLESVVDRWEDIYFELFDRVAKRPRRTGIRQRLIL